MREKLTDRAKLYLRAVDDWSADYEVAARLGDTPAPNRLVVRSMLGRLIGRRLVTWNGTQNTYRITEAGRAALNEARDAD